MKRPSVTTKCVADTYHLQGERIVEFSFPNGKGGLISLMLDNYGNPIVCLYNVDKEIEIRTDKKLDTA